MAQSGSRGLKSSTKLKPARASTRPLPSNTIASVNDRIAACAPTYWLKR